MLQPAIVETTKEAPPMQQPEKVLAVLRRGGKQTLYTKTTKTVKHSNGFETVTTR
jgi:hypothetical protein